MFFWTAPSIAAHLTTAYRLTCLPLLAGIPSPQSLTLQPSVTSATLGGLYSGVGYNCNITTISDEGPSEPESVILTTPEIGELFSIDTITNLEHVVHNMRQTLGIAVSDKEHKILVAFMWKFSMPLSYYTVVPAAPEMFKGEVGQREVMFSWSPPPVTQRNGVITSYNLSCSPSPSSLPHQTPSGPLTVAGFTPDTAYSCSLVATNSQGSGPPATTSFTTQQDCKHSQYL